MKISAKGLKLVKEFESCLRPVPNLPGHFRAYRCPANVLTIGYGHTNVHGRQFNEGSVWTQAECDAELESDMAHAESVVERHIKVELKQCQFDALVSIAFNVETAVDPAHSTLARKLNNKDYAGAAQEFHRWNRGGGRVLSGLVRRRASESLLFQGIADENFDGKPDELIHIGETEPVPQQVDAPVEKPMSNSTIGNGTKVGGGFTIAGILAYIWEKISELPDSALSFLMKLVEKPYFLTMVAGGSAFAYVYYRRVLMKKEQGV